MLPGHGGSVKDFATSSMAQWRSEVKTAVDNLTKHNDRLLIIAHSMGTLFAIENAVNGKADGLFLMNPPLSLRITPRLFATPFKVITGNIDDKWALAAKKAYSIADDHNPLNYIGWLPRYLELFREIRSVRKITAGINAPTRIFLSAHDEMVSPESSRFFKDIPGIRIKILPNSGHYYYPESDSITLRNDFLNFISI